MTNGPLAESQCFTLEGKRRILLGRVAMFAPRERETQPAFERRIEGLAEELDRDGYQVAFWFTNVPCRLAFIFIQRAPAELAGKPVKRGTRGGKRKRSDDCVL